MEIQIVGDKEERNIVYLLPPEQRHVKGPPLIINTTSRSKEEWSKGLSPFFLGPLDLYGERKSLNMENAWQFSKVYPHQVDEKGEPTEEWRNWSTTGFEDKKPHRFPNDLPKSSTPVYSYWDGQHLGYVDARIKIYAPLYAQVEKTIAFQKLQKIFRKQEGNIGLWDFDGYDYHKRGMTLEDVLYNEKLRMGHSFVLAMLLHGERYWEKANEEKLSQCTRYTSFENWKPPPPPKIIISAGFVIRSKGDFLLCHATKKKDDTPQVTDGSWTISKGIVQENETILEGALRELEEETNISLRDFPSLLPSPTAEPYFEYPVNKKVVKVFLIDDPQGLLRSDSIQLKCSSLIETTAERLAHLRGLPEVDAYHWATPTEAVQMVFKSQRKLFRTFV